MTTPETILAFWFEECTPDMWYRQSDDFDALIENRFRDAYEAACAGALDGWAETARGSLALVLLLDQFSRNLFRDDARAYAQDARCREIVDAALERGFDQELSEAETAFLYMPLMHSEDLADQKKCVALFAKVPNSNNLEYAQEHRDVIARFGRFPHRNGVLGRASTDEELAYLAAGGGFA